MSFETGQLQNAVDEGAGRLEKAAEELYAATKRFEKAEQAWDRQRLLEYAKLYHSHNGKLPGEDVRRGLVLELHGEGEIYLEYCAAKAETEALDKRYRALAAAVSARQSLLKALA